MPEELLLDDKRDALRQPCVVSKVTIEYQQMRYECMVMDISRTGMRLRMPICLPCGSNIMILPPTGFELRISQARIVRQCVVDDRDTTYFECGVHFTESAELRRHTWFLALRRAA